MQIIKSIRVVVCHDQLESHDTHRVRFHDYHWCYKLADGTWVYEEVK